MFVDYQTDCFQAVRKYTKAVCLVLVVLLLVQLVIKSIIQLVRCFSYYLIRQL